MPICGAAKGGVSDDWNLGQVCRSVAGSNPQQFFPTRRVAWQVVLAAQLPRPLPARALEADGVPAMSRIQAIHNLHQPLSG